MASEPQIPEEPASAENRYEKVDAAPRFKGGRRRKGCMALVTVEGDVTLNKNAGDLLLNVVDRCRCDPQDFAISYGFNRLARTVSVHVHKTLTAKTAKPGKSSDGVYSFNIENVFARCPELRPVVRVGCEVRDDVDAETRKPCLALLLGTGVEKRVIKRGPRKKKTDKEKEKGGPEGTGPTAPPTEPENQPEQPPAGDEKETA